MASSFSRKSDVLILQKRLCRCSVLHYRCVLVGGAQTSTTTYKSLNRKVNLLSVLPNRNFDLKPVGMIALPNANFNICRQCRTKTAKSLKLNELTISEKAFRIQFYTCRSHIFVGNHKVHTRCQQQGSLASSAQCSARSPKHALSPFLAGPTRDYHCHQEPQMLSESNKTNQNI